MLSYKKIYTISHKLSAVFMIVALLWLTVSTPFVLASQQELAKQQHSISDNQPPLSCTEEESNPFGNTTEEKAPSSNTFSEEYLHDHHITHYFILETSQYHKCENAGTYIAFHGELLVPPPNAA